MADGHVGLPFIPNSKVTEDIAEGLLGKESIEQMPVYQEVEAKKIIEADRTYNIQAAEAGPSKPSDVKKLCSRCGWDTTLPFSVDFDDADKEKFIRSVLTGCRFSKSYPIFNGRMRVTFRSRTVRESEDVSVYLHKHAAKGNLDLRLLYVLGNKMNMAMSLEKIETFNKDGISETVINYPVPTNDIYTNKDGEDDDLCLRVHKKLFLDQAVAEVTYNALYKAFLRFDTLFELLVSRSEDADFW